MYLMRFLGRQMPSRVGCSITASTNIFFFFIQLHHRVEWLHNKVTQIHGVASGHVEAIRKEIRIVESLISYHGVCNEIGVLISQCTVYATFRRCPLLHKSIN